MTSLVAVVGAVLTGWVWVTTYFVPRVEIDATTAILTNEIREVYYEVKIDSANSELAFIEQGGIKDDEQRQYDLRSFEVKFMTQKLAELK